VTRHSFDLIRQEIEMTNGNSKTAAWIGYAMSGLAIAVMVLDGGAKLVPLDVTVEAAAGLGYPGSAEFTRGLGILLLICTAFYAYPRTAILGAILLTGYLGGAAATHVRVDNPLFTHILFGVYLGILAWGGLYLRDPRVRALMPLRRSTEKV
jgi:hypothetical protein